MSLPDTRTPCGECHIQPGETCDICGARQPGPQSRFRKIVAAGVLADILNRSVEPYETVIHVESVCWDTEPTWFGWAVYVESGLLQELHVEEREALSADDDLRGWPTYLGSLSLVLMIASLFYEQQWVAVGAALAFTYFVKGVPLIRQVRRFARS